MVQIVNKARQACQFQQQSALQIFNEIMVKTHSKSEMNKWICANIQILPDLTNPNIFENKIINAHNKMITNTGMSLYDGKGSTA